MLWWAKGSWWISSKSLLGKDRGNLQVRDGALVPEKITVEWQEHVDNQWKAAPHVRCLTAAAFAAVVREEAAAVVHTVGYANVQGVRLGTYVRDGDQLLNDRPTYVKRGDEQVMMWWRSGIWYVGVRASLGEDRGYLSVKDAAAVPQAIIEKWEEADKKAKGGWGAVPTLQVITEGEFVAQVAAGAECVHLVGDAPETAAKHLGIFTRRLQQIHGRPTYQLDKTPTVWLWWAEGQWYVGDWRDAGTKRGKLSAIDSSSVAERATADWRSWDNTSQSWTFLPLVTVISKWDAAKARGGADTVHLLGSSPVHSGRLGVFVRTKEMMSGRHVYTKKSDETVKLWWAAGSWNVGTQDELTTDKGRLSAICAPKSALEGGALLVMDRSVVPESIRAQWQEYNDTTGEWHGTPLVRCSEQIPGSKVIHLVGTTTCESRNKSLGIYVRQSLVNGHAAYAKRASDPQQGGMLWWAKPPTSTPAAPGLGVWIVGAEKNLGEFVGDLYVHSDALVPEEATDKWQEALKDGKFEPAATVRCITAKTLNEEVYAGARTVQLTGQTGLSDNYSQFGVFDRLDPPSPLVNERPSYVRRGDEETMLWWGLDGYWLVGTKSKLGSNVGLAYARGATILPEDVTATWQCEQLTAGKVIAAPLLRCVTETQAAAALAGVATLHLLGSAATDSSQLGVFERQPELVNGRAAYKRRGERSDVLLWWGAGKNWYVGKAESLGMQRGNFRAVLFTDSMASLLPEVAIKEWFEFNSTTKAWTSAPGVRLLTEEQCTEEAAAAASTVHLVGGTPDGRFANKLGMFQRTPDCVNGRATFAMRGTSARDQTGDMLWADPNGFWHVGARMNLGEPVGFLRSVGATLVPEATSEWQVNLNSQTWTLAPAVRCLTDKAATEEMQEAAGTVHLVNGVIYGAPDHSMDYVKVLGAFELQTDKVNGRAAYARRQDEATVLRAEADGSWVVCKDEQVILSSPDHSLVPTAIQQWLGVEGEDAKIPSEGLLRCIPDDVLDQEVQKAPSILHLVGSASVGVYDAAGVYDRQEELVNGRAAYLKRSDANVMLWADRSGRWNLGMHKRLGAEVPIAQRVAKGARVDLHSVYAPPSAAHAGDWVVRGSSEQVELSCESEETVRKRELVAQQEKLRRTKRADRRLSEISSELASFASETHVNKASVKTHVLLLRAGELTGWAREVEAQKEHATPSVYEAVSLKISKYQETCEEHRLMRQAADDEARAALSDDSIEQAVLQKLLVKLRDTATPEVLEQLTEKRDGLKRARTLELDAQRRAAIKKRTDATQRLTALMETPDGDVDLEHARSALAEVSEHVEAALVTKMNQKLKQVEVAHAKRQAAEAAKVQKRKTADQQLEAALSSETVEPTQLTELLAQHRQVATAALVEEVTRKRDRLKSQQQKARAAARKQQEQAEEEARLKKAAEAREATRRDSEDNVRLAEKRNDPMWEGLLSGDSALAKQATERLRQQQMKARAGRLNTDRMQLVVEEPVGDEGDEGEEGVEGTEGAEPEKVVVPAVAEPREWWQREGSPWRELACDLPRGLPEAADKSGGFLAHHVLVVDNSASMSKADIRGAKDAGLGSGSSAAAVPMMKRSEAVRGVLLHQFLLTQLASGATINERISLVKLQDNDAHMPFALFPLNPSIAGKLERALGEPSGHGPYLPGLHQLATLCANAQQYMAPSAETKVLFLTDGRPSDQLDPSQLTIELKDGLEAVQRACPGVELQLLGFGEADKRTLEEMVQALPHCASFDLVSNNVATLQQSVSTFSNSVTVSRLSSVDHGSGPRRPLRKVARHVHEKMVLYEGCEIYMPPKKLGDFEERLRRLPKTHVLEISNRILGFGGERNAYRAHFVNTTPFTVPDEQWVVKESRYERTAEGEAAFHRKSLITQKWAELLANEFNKQAEALEVTGLPTISYMTCCYVRTQRASRAAHEAAAPDELPERLLFAERMIEGQFRKWNTNFGAVIRLADNALSALRSKTRDGRGESTSGGRDRGERVSDGDDAADEGGGGGGGSEGGDTDELGGATSSQSADGGEAVTVVTDDVPQAFSHFTLYHSQRPTSRILGKNGEPGRVLVCDLQGCYDTKNATFTLFDPVIHSELGEKGLFGATDRGTKGINEFLASHKCNEVCRMLMLPNNDKFVRANVCQRETSSLNTSLVTVACTHHLNERAQERDIGIHEVKAAKKKAEKFRQLNGSLQHRHGDVTLATTKDQHVGLTTFRPDHPQNEGLARQRPSDGWQSLGEQRAEAAAEQQARRLQEFFARSAEGLEALSKWWESLPAAQQLGLEQVLGKEELEQLRQIAKPFLEIKSSVRSGQDDSRAPVGAAGPSGRGAGSGGGGGGKFEALEREMDKEARREEKKLRRREGKEETQREADTGAAGAVGAEEEDEEALVEELARVHSTAAARTQPKQKALDAKAISGMSVKQLRKLLEEADIDLPASVQKPEGGDMKAAFRAFAISQLHVLNASSVKKVKGFFAEGASAEATRDVAEIVQTLKDPSLASASSSTPIEPKQPAPPDQPKESGVVKQWGAKAFGFITSREWGDEIYVHSDELLHGIHALKPGQRVLFVRSRNHAGSRAVQVELDHSAEDADSKREQKELLRQKIQMQKEARSHQL